MRRRRGRTVYLDGNLWILHRALSYLAGVLFLGTGGAVLRSSWGAAAALAVALVFVSALKWLVHTLLSEDH